MTNLYGMERINAHGSEDVRRLQRRPLLGGKSDLQRNSGHSVAILIVPRNCCGSIKGMGWNNCNVQYVMQQRYSIRQ